MKDFFVRYKSPLAVMAFIVIGAGIFSFETMQTSLFPEITFPKVKVIADDGLQPIDKMMITVTKPLERALKRIPNLVTVRSATSRGECEISAYFNWGTDIDLAKQQVESAVNEIRTELPPGVGITAEKMNPSILQVMGYTIEDTTRSPVDLDLVTTNQIIPYLSQVEGIAQVFQMGAKRKEYWVEMDRRAMSMLSLEPDAVLTSLRNANFIEANGFLSEYRRMYLSVTDARVKNIDDLRNLVVRNDGKRIVYLRDVAQIEVHEQVQYVRINANGRSALLLGVVKQPNASLITVTDAVTQKVSELNAGLLPKGMQLKPYYIQADFVNDSISSVRDALMIGLVLALLVVFVFLRSLRSSAVILMTIPVTVSLSLVVIHAVGYTFNIMTLGAMAAAVALVIDDAIVVLEQIHRTHEEYPREGSFTLVQKAIGYLLPAMIGSSLSTIVIFIPFVLMSGVAGAYFSVLTTTMIITLVASFFITWIALPVFYLLLAPKDAVTTVEAHSVKPQRWVQYLMHRPIYSIGFVVFCIVAIVYLPSHLETGFLPEMDEGSIVLDYSSPPGTSLDETDRMLREIEKNIVKIPEVESYSRRTGTQMGFFITEPNTGDYLIQLKKSRHRTTDEVIADIRTHIEAQQPSLRVDFGQVIGDMLGDLMTSVQPVEVKIFGEDRYELAALADTVSAIVRSVSGTADVFRGIVISGPSVSIAPDYTKLAQYHITPDNFKSQMQAIMQGTEAGVIFEHELQTTIRLLYPHSTSVTSSSLRDSRISLPSGELIPLSEVATVSVSSGDAEIDRENLQSMLAVTARLSGRDLGSVMKDVRSKISASVALPKGYHITYGGAYAQQQQSFKELLMILLLSALLVFTTILFLFRKLKIALLIMAMAALGIAGSLTALFVTGTPLNVGSYTGLIMMVGIIGENAIFTYLQFRDMLKTGTVDDSIVFAISTRLRPKLMTAIGAIFALAPIALGIGTGAELHQPLAIAVIGGFIFALPILLVVFPSFLRLTVRKQTS
ncbi:MAG TPA: efflux RND transporter permease subunit [Candidatus Kapabacteria bacterium]|nr:efflux RND transporter permease subunit [Candidatus Kapabacteria bacterium]